MKETAKPHCYVVLSYGEIKCRGDDPDKLERLAKERGYLSWTVVRCDALKRPEDAHV